MSNDDKGQSISKSDDFPPSDILASDEDLELKEKLKFCQGREVTKDDLLKIIQDTHQILNEEILTLRNELEKKFEVVTLSMNSRDPNKDSKGA